MSFCTSLSCMPTIYMSIYMFMYLTMSIHTCLYIPMYIYIAYQFPVYLYAYQHLLLHISYTSIHISSSLSIYPPISELISTLIPSRLIHSIKIKHHQVMKKAGCPGEDRKTGRKQICQHVLLIYCVNLAWREFGILRLKRLKFREDEGT